MDEAVDVAINGHFPYPECAAFIEQGPAWAGLEIKCAADEGLAVVLVAANASTRASLRLKHCLAEREFVSSIDT